MGFPSRRQAPAAATPHASRPSSATRRRAGGSFEAGSATTWRDSRHIISRERRPWLWNANTTTPSPGTRTRRWPRSRSRPATTARARLSCARALAPGGARRERGARGGAGVAARSGRALPVRGAPLQAPVRSGGARAGHRRARARRHERGAHAGRAQPAAGHRHRVPVPARVGEHPRPVSGGERRPHGGGEALGAQARARASAPTPRTGSAPTCCGS